MKAMSIEELYERHIKSRPMAEQLRLLSLIAQGLVEQTEGQEGAGEEDPAVEGLKRILEPKGTKTVRKRGGLKWGKYRPFILKALAKMGGRGRGADVLEQVYEMVKGYLKPEDHERLPKGGDFRWRKKANWERCYMVRDGLLRSDSPRGIWELTESGWQEALRELEEGARVGDDNKEQ